MPTATKFEAEEVYTGFPQCWNKRDVSTYWGVKALTLNQAMELYWNMSAIESSADISSTASATASLAYTDLLDQPRERVCGVVNVSDFDSNTVSSETATAFTIVSNGALLRAYDGVTTNEANFIGYIFQGGGANGREGFAHAEADYTGGVERFQSYCSYVRFAPGGGISVTSETLGTTNAPVYKYTSTFGTMPSGTISATVSAPQFYTY